MQDILLSTTPPSAGASGLAVGGAASAAGTAAVSTNGAQITTEGSDFGATLTGVFHSELSPERLEEISAKLEALGLDSSFLDDITSLLSGNLLSLEGGEEGMSLPQLSTFLTSSLAELEKSLDLSASDLPEGLSQGLSEELAGSLFEVINTIQQVVSPSTNQSPTSLLLPQQDGAASLSVLAGQAGQVMEMKKNNSQAAWTGPGLNAAPGAQAANVDIRGTGETVFQGLMVPEQSSTASGTDRPVSTLSTEQFAKFMGDNAGGANANNVDAILEKVAGGLNDRSSPNAIKTTFAEAQHKLENTPYSTTVMTGLDDIQWGEEVGQKIVWLTGKAIQSAEIHLNPAELGPIDVKISVQNDAAAVTFNAHNASVREMLESNVVRLREMMETNGVELQEVNVDARQGDERFASSDQQQGGAEEQEQGDELSGVEETAVSEQSEISSSNIVDYFA